MNDEKMLHERIFENIQTLRYKRFEKNPPLLNVPIQVDEEYEFKSSIMPRSHNEARFVRLFKVTLNRRNAKKTRYCPLVIKVYYLGYLCSNQRRATERENKMFTMSVEKEQKVCQLFATNPKLKSSGFIQQRVVEIQYAENYNEDPSPNDLFIVAMPFYSIFLDKLVKFPSSVQMTCALRQAIFIQLLYQLKVGREHNYYYMDIKPGNIAVNVVPEGEDCKKIRLIARFADLNSVNIYSYQPLLFSHGLDDRKYPLANVFLWLIYSIGKATQNQNRNQKQNIFEARLRNLLRRGFNLFDYPSPPNTSTSKRSHGISSSSMLLYLVNTLYNFMHPLFFSQSSSVDLDETQFCQQVLDVAFTEEEKPFIYFNELNPLFTSSCSSSSSSSSCSPRHPSQISNRNSFEYILLILLSA